MSTFELSPGVVVDTDRHEAYVMNPGGGIVAVDLEGGKEVWRSTEAAKPLAVAGDLLVSQAEPAGPNDALRIVSLHTRKGGAPETRGAVVLPPGVQPMIDQTLNRSFIARAQPVAGDAEVFWEFVERPLRGVASGPVEVLPGEAPPEMVAEPPGAVPAAAPTVEPGEATVVRGAARVALADGRVTPMATPSVEVGAAPGAGPLAAAPGVAPTISGIPEPQFLSADGRHVMSSKRVGNESVWDKYAWKIFDRNSGRELGEVRTHVRYAPFFVSDPRVIYQIEPYARRVGENIVEEPMQIRAADLQTGERLWSHAVRDVTDREPPPP